MTSTESTVRVMMRKVCGRASAAAIATTARTRSTPGRLTRWATAPRDTLASVPTRVKASAAPRWRRRWNSAQPASAPPPSASRNAAGWTQTIASPWRRSSSRAATQKPSGAPIAMTSSHGTR
jgi:hypothetical protein